MSAHETAWTDIQCLKRVLFSSIRSQSFSAVYVFSFLRDACIAIEEINNSFKLTDFNLVDNDIKKIRQNIKIFGSNEKGGNKAVYEKIRTTHEDSFEEWENNIGFYLMNEKVLGSTLYNTYIFKGSSFENPYKLTTDDKLKLKFQKLVSETVPHTLINLENHLNPDQIIQQPTIKPIKNEITRDFDVRAELFFNDKEYSIMHQSMVFRLILTLQELNYVRFIYLNFLNNQDNFFDNYYFSRILTKNMDTVLKNLINISKYQAEDFMTWMNSIEDYELRHKIQGIFEHEHTIFKWIKKYRDMVHYDIKNPKNNFLNFFMDDSEEVFKKCYTIYHQILLPIREGILSYIQVNKQDQYSLFKMLYYRRKIKHQRKKRSTQH